MIPALMLDATKIAYVAADRAQQNLEKKLNMPNVRFYSLVDDKTFNLDWLRQGDIALRRVLDRLGSFDLLILDPIAPFTMGSLVDYRSVMISLIHIGRITAAASKWTFPSADAGCEIEHGIAMGMKSDTVR